MDDLEFLVESIAPEAKARGYKKSGGPGTRRKRA